MSEDPDLAKEQPQQISGETRKSTIDLSGSEVQVAPKMYNVSHAEPISKKDFDLVARPADGMAFVLVAVGALLAQLVAYTAKMASVEGVTPIDNYIILGLIILVLVLVILKLVVERSSSVWVFRFPDKWQTERSRVWRRINSSFIENDGAEGGHFIVSKKSGGDK